MDHDDAAPGVPLLDRQDRPPRLDAQGRTLVPQRVPETKPTPLADAFIYLSIVVLICGVIAIMALELGTPMSSLLVKVPVLIGGLVLLVVTADALVRVWRSVRAWGPVDRGRALFRLLWAALLAGSLLVVAAIVMVTLWA
ncbi:hypothetical protein BH24CHL9_BH24CHL9_11650 [soil metagenome]